MMMNRDRLGFWARVGAIVLSVIFIGSFVFMGIGTNVQYNIFDLIRGQNQQSQQQSQGGVEQQVKAIQSELKENPDDPDTIKQAAGIYFQASRLDDAERVAKHGREVAPKDAEMAILLGQVQSQKALSAKGKKQKGAYRDAAEQYVAASKLEPKNADAVLLAGQAYEQAGDVGRAIQYYNSYLDKQPNGENSKIVKQRIDQLLNGEETTGASGVGSGGGG